MKPTSAHGHGDELSNPGVAHETSDVNVRAILWFAVIVTVTTIVCAVVVWGVFNLLESQAAGRDPKMSPLAMPAATMPRTTTASPFFGNGPAPQLMTDEPAHLAHQRLLEDTKLHQYGWVDEKSGVTRLPIDQAKKLLVRARPAGPCRGQRRVARHAHPGLRRIEWRTHDSDGRKTGRRRDSCRCSGAAGSARARNPESAGPCRGRARERSLIAGTAKARS